LARSSRWWTVPLLAIAVVAFAIAALQSRHQPAAPATPSVEVRSIGARPIEDPSQRPKKVRLNLPERPALGRTLYVNAKGPPNGDGSSEEQPLTDLQAALCALEPGDRLVIWDGDFRGPFSIGADCSDGTAEAPIEVYAAADAVLYGGAHSNEPVLTVARAHWQLHDLMVVPLESVGAGVLVRDPAKEIDLDSPHIRSGRGNGIEIHPGVTGVQIRAAHIHHMGIQEGGGSRNPLDEGGGGKRGRGERVDPATTPPGAGIRIYPGTRRIQVEASEIRNIWGQPLEVVSPADIDPELAPAAELEIDDSGFVKEQQEKWW
jgi:hypothetical protein